MEQILCCLLMLMRIARFWPRFEPATIQRYLQEKELEAMSMKAIPQVAILVVGFCTLSGCSSADAPATPAAAGKPEHEVKTTAAWVALAKNDFELAVKHADKVINQFAPAAARMEQQAKDGAAKIPVGAVSAEKEREIFSRGVLNDVAACQFIKAQALHKLGRPEEAKAAFTQASKLTAARGVDPSRSDFLGG